VESPIRHARTLNATPRYALSVGFNFTAVSLLAGLLLIQATTPTTTGTAAQGRVAGADWARSEAAAPTAGTGEEAGTGEQAGTGQDPPAYDLPLLEQADEAPFFDRVTPDPLVATDDVPAYYGQDCDASLVETTVRMCQSGDLDGDVVVAVVGDSKIGQWMPALEQIATDRGWLLRFYSKSACSFGSATPVAGGEPYTDCTAWSRDVLDRLTGEEQPAVVITSSIRAKAVDEAGRDSREELVAGYVDYWSRLGDQGTRVVAISDTPQPMEDPTPYECALEHPGDIVAACAWPSDDGIGSAALQEAAAQVDTAEYVDMNPWVCPEGTCLAVYRNVLTYRQGSHITATFAAILADPLASLLAPLVEGTSSQAP
ncbi:hypothetical protein MWU75_19460, partial [Ornithinimicrobium sp. F0845]|uniref:SGNH hydrolase domain-containing protein n=1 Tax=Ornithinimicrobium sp. F0845 TaxID=2926412 RepID=UPI00248D288D